MMKCRYNTLHFTIPNCMWSLVSLELTQLYSLVKTTCWVEGRVASGEAARKTANCRTRDMSLNSNVEDTYRFLCHIRGRFNK
jgi:hypothetical protein